MLPDASPSYSSHSDESCHCLRGTLARYIHPLAQTTWKLLIIKLIPGGYLASIENECENDFVTELLGQTSGWDQTYLGATDLDTEGTWTWIKTGGSTFWEGGDPTAGGAVVSGLYANFFDGEPNDGGNGQDCLVIGVNPFSTTGQHISPGKRRAMARPVVLKDDPVLVRNGGYSMFLHLC